MFHLSSFLCGGGSRPPRRNIHIRCASGGIVVTDDDGDGPFEPGTPVEFPEHITDQVEE